MTKAGRDELRAAAISLLRNPDLSCTEIARRLNVSPGYVQSAQKKYCPERRAARYRSGPDTTGEAVKERREMIGRLLRENLSLMEIARRVGMSDTTVSRIQREYYPEIPREPRKPNRQWNQYGPPRTEDL